MDLERIAKALDTLYLDMEQTPTLAEASHAWAATRERVHWLAECASALAFPRTDHATEDR